MLTCVELFAGAGGLALGLAQAGFAHRAVVEWNHDACETLRMNHGAEWPLHESDVRDLDFSALADRIDLVAGGPPCQPFSLGGRHQGVDDQRDMFPAFAEVVRAVRPRAFLVENVKGLTRPGFAQYFQYILARLGCADCVRDDDESWADHARRLQAADRSYDVSFQLVNAADYGVPQSRERVFIVGIRRDLDARWIFPAPTHKGARRTVGQALAGLPDPEFDPVGAARFAHHRFQPGVRFYPGHRGSAWDRPAKTLKAGDHGVPGGENALVRPDGTGRYFSVREAARLQTFPDDYGFAGGWGAAMRQLGNAVPVALARTMGASLARILAPVTVVDCAAG